MWFYQSAKVLMVGAGGIGCELLKTLALSGFQDIHIVSTVLVLFIDFKLWIFIFLFLEKSELLGFSL